MLFLTNIFYPNLIFVKCLLKNQKAGIPEYF